MKVSREIAEAEINGWLDYKRVGEKKRETYKDQIDSLVDAICEGFLSLKDDKTFTLVYELREPIGSDSKISKLEFKPRLKMGVIHQHLQGVKPSDADGRVCAYIAALTSTTKSVLSQMDSEDYAVPQSIAIFFL